MSRKYAVSGAHDASVEVASQILRESGNAFDALCAAYFVSCTSEPLMATLYSGALTVFRPAGGTPIFLDGFCQTPSRNSSTSELIPIEVNFEGTQEYYFGGAGSVAIPGIVKSLWYLHKHYGRVPFRQLVAPGIKAAKEGVALNSFQYEDFNLLVDVFRKDPYLRTHFLESDLVRPPGSVIANPDLADTLDVLAREGSRVFYEGELAQMAVDVSDDAQLTREDFAHYELGIYRTLDMSFGKGQLHLPGLPSKGGYILAALLSVENFQLASVDRTREIRKVGGDLQQLSRYNHLPEGSIRVTTPIAGGTSHINIIDGEGNAVSMSYSLGEGSGIVLPGTGVHMNNMLGEPSLLPRGLRSWTPSTRLESRMTPLLYTGGDQLWSLGTGGADRIPFMLSQVLAELARSGDFRHSVEAPRFNLADGKLHHEPGWLPPNDKVVEDLCAWKQKNMYFGGVHVAASASEMVAVGDRRRMGGEVNN